MNMYVSPYGQKSSHRSPLLGLGDGRVEADVPPSPSLPPPVAVFGTISGLTVAVPVAVMLGHRFFVRGAKWGRSLEVGLIAAGLLYLLGGVATAGAAASAVSVMREGS